MNFIQAGQMKPILIDVPKRLEGFADLPTFKDKGIPFELNYWRGIWAKSDTPKEAVAFLDVLLRRAMAEPGYAKYEKAGFYHLVPGYMNRDQFTKYVSREVEVYKGAYGGKK
jgi:tripartite-type tricarboxylate transporter receptor subunit TctC